MSENSKNETCEQNNEAKYILLALSIKTKGNWDEMFQKIKDKEHVTPYFIEKAKSFGYNFLTILDEEYPEVLKTKFKPPFILYYEGNIDLLNSTRTLSILSSNVASVDSCESVVNISKDLVNDYVFVMGVSSQKNIEIAKKLISSGGKIIAILDVGIGKENFKDQDLYEELVKNHLVISTYPREVKAKSRETILSSTKLACTLSNNLLVGAVGKHSVESVGLAFAFENANNVFCIPFNVGTNYINNQLIHDGAILVENASMIDEKVRAL